jgi:hypothetical protein
VGVSDYFDQLQRFADQVMAHFSAPSIPSTQTDPPPQPPARDRILTMTSHGNQPNRS